MNFSNFLKQKSLLEANKGQMDISIKQLWDNLKTEEKIKEFLNDEITIEAKTDGIKCTIIHCANTGDYKKDFIVAYKGAIQYPSETEKFGNMDKIEKEGYSESQFAFIWNKLKNVKASSLPLNQEFFIEFLVKRSTVMSSYNKLDGILLASSKTEYTAKNGKLVSKPENSFDTSNIDKYAKILGLKTPPLLFKGKLSKLPSGIVDSRLKGPLSNIDKTLDSKSYLNEICKALLDLDSLFGEGKEEGVVFKTSNGEYYKIQQNYQFDTAKRDEKKTKFRGTREEEDVYNNNVNNLAKDLSNKLLDSLSDKEMYDEDLKVDKLSTMISKEKLKFSHPKKTELQIKEDILRAAKTYMFANTKGNKNFLFLGKMRILQNGHYNTIKAALNQFDGGVVCLISGKDTRGTEELRLKMLEKAFGDKIKVITHPTGNIWSILGKSPLQISTIFCGTDRYEDYKKQVSKSTIKVKEIKRDDDSISATKVINNITDEEYFKKNTPKEIHSMYPEILKAYKSQGLKESYASDIYSILKERNLF